MVNDSIIGYFPLYTLIYALLESVASVPRASTVSESFIIGYAVLYVRRVLFEMVFAYVVPTHVSSTSIASVRGRKKVFPEIVTSCAHERNIPR